MSNQTFKSSSEIEKVSVDPVDGTTKTESSSLEHQDEKSEDKNATFAQKSRGIAHIEAIKESMEHVDNGRFVTILFGVSILITAWAYSLDSATTYNYQPYATSSFNKHSMLSTLGIATNIMTAICKPFIAKISDLTSRPLTYILVLTLYVMGYIIVACSPTIAAYIVGDSFVSVGGSGITLLNSLVVADLTPLKWRGFMNSLLSTPYIINTWFSGLIVQDIVGSNWRWGYGMFAIIMPVTITPAICIMLWLDHKANKEGKISLNAYGQERQVLDRNWAKTIKNALIEIDAFGLLLLGFGFSLLLLPFSLKAYAENGWKNPSMIAMLVVGAVILIFFGIYEVLLAPFPLMPKRIVFNRTFAMAVVIDFFYQFAGNYYSLYFSSYVYVVKTWSIKNWTYFNNTLTIALCFFGVVAGVYMRIFHRYKVLQICGLCIKIIGIGIIVSPNSVQNDAKLIMSRILIGMGGSFSVVSSRVASEASVPHQDLGSVISLLSLWSYIGAAIGSAISGVIWTEKMPANLKKYMPDTVNSTQLATFFGKLTSLRQYPMGSPIREGGIMAYIKSMHPLICISLGLSFIPLIAAFFQTNYYLGEQLNAVEGEQPEDYHEALEHKKRAQEVAFEEEEKVPKTRMDKIASFFNQPLLDPKQKN